MTSGIAKIGRRYNPPPPPDRGQRQVTGVQAVDQQTIDEFSNVLARIGYGTPSLQEGAAYPLTRLTRNYILMQSLYRSNWIARKVIDCPAEDMLKNWLELTIDAAPQALDRFTKVIRKTQTRAKLLQTLKWARLFGGAGAVMMIAGHESQLDKPLDYDDVELDSYRGLLVFDRWSGIYPDSKLCDDLENAVDFGLPESYQITMQGGQTQHVHCSRVLRFIGRDLPYWEKQVEMNWGMSEFELLYTELRKRDNTSLNIANLVFRANVMAMRVKDLAQNLSTNNAAAQQRMFTAVQAMNQMMSNQGLLILDEAGGLENHTYSFPGINEVYQSFMMDICGATEIPFTRLFGRTQTGLGQSNEGDNQIYFGSLSQKQEREVTPQLDKLLPVVAMSTWGEVPEDFDYRWLPIRELSDQDMSQLSTATTNNVVTVYNSGLISQRGALKELKQHADVTGDWTNITDEDLANANDDVPESQAEQQQAQQEMAEQQMMGGGGFGQPEAEEGAEPSTEEGGGEEIRDSLPLSFQRRWRQTKDAFSRAWGGDVAQLVKVGPLEVRVEQPVGSTRHGAAPDGAEWSVRFTAPYGEIVGTIGADGDPVDCFLGPDLSSKVVYVIHQNTAQGHYDEDKVILGARNEREAKGIYWANFNQPQRFFGSMTSMPLATFAKRVMERRGVALDEFNEEEHPREEHGKFTAGAGQSGTKKVVWVDKIDEKFVREMNSPQHKNMLRHVEVEFKNVFLSDLKLMTQKGEVHPRSQNKWNKAIEHGKRMPVIVVHKQADGTLFVDDGNHRAHALADADVKTVRVALLTPKEGYTFGTRGSWFGTVEELKQAKEISANLARKQKEAESRDTDSDFFPFTEAEVNGQRAEVEYLKNTLEPTEPAKADFIRIEVEGEDAAPAKKLSREEVKFEHPAQGSKHCSECAHFNASNHTCALVEGHVEPVDWCVKFEWR